LVSDLTYQKVPDPESDLATTLQYMDTEFCDDDGVLDGLNGCGIHESLMLMIALVLVMSVMTMMALMTIMSMVFLTVISAVSIMVLISLTSVRCVHDDR
jgi:hypothetical protein